MQEATLAIAIVGAVTGVGSLGWQVYTWFAARKPRVRVVINYSIPIGVPEPESVVMITVQNHNDFPIRVTSVGFYTQDRSGRTAPIMTPPPGGAIPGGVPAHDSGATWITETAFRAIPLDPYRRVVAFARVATGETFKSRRTAMLRRR